MGAGKCVYIEITNVLGDGVTELENVQRYWYKSVHCVYNDCQLYYTYNIATYTAMSIFILGCGE